MGIQGELVLILGLILVKLSVNTDCYSTLKHAICKVAGP